jgi:ABC-type uncharacterized transport system ATPase subunit
VSDYVRHRSQTRLAEGTSSAIQRDPRVIAAYLGEAPAPLDELVLG